MAEQTDYYIEENRDHDRRKVHTSPSGKYILTVDSYGTKPGCWNYTRGRVSCAETGAEIADVKRNYGSFPFLWIEGHPNGHEAVAALARPVAAPTGRVVGASSEGAWVGRDHGRASI